MILMAILILIALSEVADLVPEIETVWPAVTRTALRMLAARNQRSKKLRRGQVDFWIVMELYQISLSMVGLELAGWVQRCSNSCLHPLSHRETTCLMKKVWTMNLFTVLTTLPALTMPLSIPHLLTAMEA